MIRLCPKCGNMLKQMDPPKYLYKCAECNKNFYDIETNRALLTAENLIRWLGTQMDSFQEYMDNNIDSDPDYYGYDENTLYKLLRYVDETDPEILEEEYCDSRK